MKVNTESGSNINNLEQSAALGSNMKQYLGNCDPNEIPGFPNIELSEFPNNWGLTIGPAFEELYSQHCSTLVQSIFELNFSR